MPRFIVLHHQFPPGHQRATHWDLLLERGEVLRSWALESPPQVGRTTAATDLADHRRLYLDYEGPISGDRGSVTQWAAGTYELLSETADEWAIRLEGPQLAGTARLVRDAFDAQRWVFSLSADD